MTATRITGSEVKDGSITKDDLAPGTIDDTVIALGSLTKNLFNITTPGSAVITNVIAGDGIDITQTGIDAGTGAVTIKTETYQTVNSQSTLRMYASNILDSGNYAAVLAGQSNQITSGGTKHHTVIVGGSGNQIQSTGIMSGSFIGGGVGNIIDGHDGKSSINNLIGGGYQNNISGGLPGSSWQSNHNAIVGGINNNIYASPIWGSNSNYNFIGGGGFNGISDSIFAVIAGGYNSNAGSYSFIGGGLGNITSDFCAIGGGCRNRVLGNSSYAGILGGYYNKVDASKYSVIGGGANNYIFGSIFFADVSHGIFSGEYNSIAVQVSSARNVIVGGGGVGYRHLGGFGNRIFGRVGSSIIGAGRKNLIQSVGGPPYNTCLDAAVLSGYSNVIESTIASSSHQSLIGGGHGNLISASHTSIIVGGYTNWIDPTGFGIPFPGDPAYSIGNLIGGGRVNVIAGGFDNVIVGGVSNFIAAGVYRATIAGGLTNTIGSTAYAGFIGAGSNIYNNGLAAGSAAGAYNELDAEFSFIGGSIQARTSVKGEHAQASGSFSMIGDAQTSTYVIKAKIDTVNWTTLLPGGAAFTLDDDGAYLIDAHLIARNPATNENHGWITKAIYYRDSGTLAEKSEDVTPISGVVPTGWGTRMIVNLPDTIRIQFRNTNWVSSPADDVYVVAFVRITRVLV